MAHKIVLELTTEEFHRRADAADRECFPETSTPSSVKFIPVIINFERLFGNPKQNNVFQDIPNKDLFHAVAALYDSSLSEVTEDVIYPAIHEKWSRTVLLIQEKDDALEWFKSRSFSKLKNAATNEEIQVRSQTSQQIVGESALIQHEFTGDVPVSEQQYISVEQNSPELIDHDTQNKTNIVEAKSETQDSPYSLNGGEVTATSKDEESRFAHVFSDMESSGSDEDEEEVEEYMSGVEDFLAGVKKRKQDKERWQESVRSHNCSGEPYSLIGIEHRLLACATFEQSYKKPGHKVIHLSLIAVRKRFRKMGLGSFMARIIKNSTFAGRYDAIVVNADHNATDFFEKEGFSGDVLLNSKYAEIGDTWFNCKRMCYLPPYQSTYESLSTIGQNTTDTLLTELEDLDIKQMELDIALFEEKSLQAYQAQSAIVQRLRKEVILLRARVSAQQDTIQVLTKENHAVRDSRLACEKQLLKMRLALMTDAADNLLNFESDEEDLTTSDKAAKPVMST